MKKSFATLLTVVILLSALALPVSALVSDSAYDYICEIGRASCRERV